MSGGDGSRDDMRGRGVSGGGMSGGDFEPLTTCNIASHIPAMARKQPYKRAVVVPAGRSEGRVTWAHYTFQQLDEASDRYAHGLERIGITRGVRTVLMVSPSLEFFALVFALFKVGAVLVLIDPGLDRKQVLKCLGETEPEAFIGIPLAHLARLLFPRPFRTVRVCVTVGRRLAWGGYRLEDLKGEGPYEPYRMADTDPDDVAAILFTSGSTGIPKGAVYTHGMFDAQVRMIQATYHIGPDEIDLPTFPLFALFDPALGMTAIIPDMDFRKPGEADPVKLIEAITDQGATQMFGSPALLERLGRHGAQFGIKLPSLKRILSSGAPMRHDVLKRISGMLCGEAQVFTPYGATEALPVANIGHREVLEQTHQLTASGQGICVGWPVDGIQVRVIRITDDPLETWSDDLLVPTGVIGEITVRGPVVTREYWARPDQTRLAKIREGDAIVHRMGDVGYFDTRGRLWMCGRKGHRVETRDGPMFSVPVEEIFNQHKQVRRTALVWVGERPTQTPVLCVEPEASAKIDAETLVRELLEIGANNPLTDRIRMILVFPESFPVDIRHNAKIGREKLAVWAAGKVTGEIA